MNREEILSRVVKIVADVLQASPDSVAASPSKSGDWESVQALSIALSIEEAFGLELQPEEMERMTSVGAIAEVVAGRLGR